MKYEGKVLPRLASVAFTLASFLLLAGCSGGKGDAPDPSEHGAEASSEHGADSSGATSEIAEVQQIRKEFVVMRELVRQHKLQQGNDARMAAIEKALKEKFSLLPDDGTTDGEKRIYREAEKLVETLKR